MKRSIHVILGALLTAVFLAACAPAFEPELGTDYARQQEETALRYFTITAAISGGGSLTVQPKEGVVTHQKIEITTTGRLIANPSATSNAFNLVLDGGKIKGIKLHTVSLPDGAEVVSHGSELEYTAVATADNKVELYLPLRENELKIDSTDTTNTIVLVADPAEVRFSGEGKLNTDRDIVLGEDTDDLYFTYFSVNSNTAVTPNIALTKTIPTDKRKVLPSTKMNLSSFSVASAAAAATAAEGGIIKEGGTKVVVQLPQSADGKYGHYDKGSLVAAFRFQKYNPNAKGWASVGVTASDLVATDTSATLTLSLPPSSLYDVYRYQVKLYEIAEKEAVLGYVRRASYDQTHKDDYTDKGGDTGWELVEQGTGNYYTNQNKDGTVPALLTSLTASSKAISGKYYIDVTASEGASINSFDLDASTLTKDNIRVFYGADYNTGKLAEIKLENTAFQKLDSTSFRISLPSTVARVNESNAKPVILINGVKAAFTFTLGPDDKEDTAGIFDPSKAVTGTNDCAWQIISTNTLPAL